jgi:hypothetical protein
MPIPKSRIYLLSGQFLALLSAIEIRHGQAFSCCLLCDKAKTNRSGVSDLPASAPLQQKHPMQYDIQHDILLFCNNPEV